jgi:aminopeptidase N
MPAFTPNHYEIEITPNLEAQTFFGRVTVEGSVEEPGSELWLHALELTIRECRVSADGEPLACTAATDRAGEKVAVSLSRAVSGKVTLQLAYEGVLNDRMAGFYRSGYESDAGPAIIAVTQFQESDARRAFPCIDHPAAKATFDVALVIDSGLTAIGNMPVASETLADGGKRRVAFSTTPRMSTYLVFFSVGDYRISVDAGDPRVRTVVLPGKGNTDDFGREFGRKSLQYCEDYTGIPYPLEKMDLIAIPDFAFGAMENWGAITFRENLLLYDSEKTSSAGKERICEVTAHEVVHQWFGNLVTPSDWRYLWLNESFATYFGYGIVDHYYPEWKTWHQFINGQTGAAMKRDALPGTVAIEIPSGEHVVINSSTAPIIYNKGASILRHIRGFIGDTHFQKGLAAYLNGHAYANAGSDDFWKAFESVSDQPVSTIMKSWVEQPGFPLLEVDRDKDRLRIRQRRFSYLPGTDDQRWHVPVTIAFWDASGRSWQETVLLTEAEAQHAISSDTAVYKVNAGQSGFYRTRYRDTSNADALAQMAAAGDLSPEDRWGLQSDLYELAKNGAEPFQRFLDLVSACTSESEFLPLLGMSENLFEAFHLASPTARDGIRDVAGRLVARALQAIGTAPGPDAPQPLATLRDQLVWQAVCYGDDAVRQATAARFQELRDGGDVHPDLMRSTLQAGAAAGDDRTLDWFIQRLSTSESEHHRMDLVTAMGAFSDAGILEKALAYGVTDVPDRIRFLMVAAAAVNPAGDGVLWQWFQDQRSLLEKGHPLLYERMLISVILGAGLTRPETVRAFFLSYREENGTPTDAIDLALGKLEVNVRFRGWVDRTMRG